MKRSESNRIFIDCEWNDYRGDLISMALVAERGDEFYEVLSWGSPSPWVAANVIPVLNQPSIDRKLFVQRLASFLARFDGPHIVADWPEDIEHFCRALVVSPGGRVGPDRWTMEIVRLPEDSKTVTASKIPHNALEDARAIRATILSLEA